MDNMQHQGNGQVTMNMIELIDLTDETSSEMDVKTESQMPNLLQQVDYHNEDVKIIPPDAITSKMNQIPDQCQNQKATEAQIIDIQQVGSHDPMCQLVMDEGNDNISQIDDTRDHQIPDQCQNQKATEAQIIDFGQIGSHGPMCQLIKDDRNVTISQHDDTSDDNSSDDESAEDSTNSEEDQLDKDYRPYYKYKYNKRRRLRKKKRTTNTDADLINKTKKIDGRRNNKGRKMINEIRNSDQQIHNEMLKFYQTCSDALVMVDGQKRFKCNICNENLSSKNSLFHHNLVHTGKKPYICNFKNCGATFKQPVGRAFHEKKYHLEPTGRKNKFMKMDKVQIDGNGEKEGLSDFSKKTEQSPESSKTKTLLPEVAGPSSSFRTSVDRQILSPGLGRMSLSDDQFEDLKNCIISTVQKCFSSREKHN